MGMVTMKRRAREVIRVGDITFCILGVDGRQVSVGIDAPREIEISHGDMEEKPPVKSVRQPNYYRN